MMKARQFMLLLIPLFILQAGPVEGRELSVMGGLIRDTESHDHEYAFQLEYSGDVAESFTYSVSWLNEGHFEGHHRDGLILQMWWKRPVSRSDIVLKAGLGPYLYFDTNQRSPGPYLRNEHGFAAVFSASAEWRFQAPFVLQGRVNGVMADNDLNTLSFLFGLGIDLDREIDPGPRSACVSMDSPKNELMPFAGFMISNNCDPRKIFAWGVEYRRRLGRFMSVTLAWLDEGDNDFFHRQGLVAQWWVGDDFFRNRLTLGIGFGPYLARNEYCDRLTGKDEHVLAGFLSMGAGYRFNGNWTVRLTWSRVVTDYDRDTDIFSIGPAYRF